ncbi:MAG: glycosyltransferase family 4 protein [Aeromonas sp.]|uniref:glycosyltransferase family 4 protein n=1 Tax=Aeromonas sp. TaxID=647 RepID=UPI003F3AFE04
MFIVNLSRIGRSGTGMWNYSLNFIEGLKKLELLSAIICSEGNVEKLSKFGVEIIRVPDLVSNTSKISKIRPLLWFVYSFFISLRIMCRGGSEVIVSTTHHSLPIIKKQIITIHDLRPYKYPDSLLQRCFFRVLLPIALKRCCHVITVSQTVKQKISQCYKYPMNKISVIFNSINAKEFKPMLEKQHFLLAVGSSWHHKNIDSFLKVHSLWIDKFKLIIVCGETAYVSDLKKYVVENNLSECVEFRHNIEFTDLVDLYSAASALIYPSLDEGFGIPPVEAMSSLTPVIVSDIKVFHEILGDAAIYVDPSSRVSWTLALKKLPLDNTSLFYAQACAEKYTSDVMQDMISSWIEKI